MKHLGKSVLRAAIVASFGVSGAAMATNGMNMEGYGPEATAMGGASFAYDNGAAAMANNPATLGLMGDGSRLDIALGNLRPDVDATSTYSQGQPSAHSDGDSYFLPAVGWVKKQGGMSYGVGIYAVGGMGTEYAGDTFMSAGTGEKSLSQVGVGRLIAPLTMDVSDALTVGGSLDFMWGGLDLQMAMPVADPTYGAVPGTFADFSPAFGGHQVLGSAEFSPSMATAFNGMVQNGVTAVRFDFADSSDFTGSAKAYGVGGKLGFVYKVSPTVRIGGVWQSEVAMSDWETSTGAAKLQGWAGSYKAGEISGTMKAVDFNWPSTFGLGVSVDATDRLMLAADVKQIRWSDTMDTFKLTFTADDSNAAYGIAEGDTVDVSLNQAWDNQTVVSLGGAYKVSDALTVRAGANLSDNPVPDEYLNPLFPAIIENHYTAGLTYAMGGGSSISASLAIAPEVKQTNTNTGIESTHSQTNWQLMYTKMFN